MMAMTLETALSQLKACRDDFTALVRQRRANAKAELAEATRMADVIKASDAEAVAWLQAFADAPGTSAALKQHVNQQLAFHRQVKQDQAAEV
jgi:hypothetical protein